MVVCQKPQLVAQSWMLNQNQRPLWSHHHKVHLLVSDQGVKCCGGANMPMPVASATQDSISLICFLTGLP